MAYNDHCEICGQSQNEIYKVHGYWICRKCFKIWEKKVDKSYTAFHSLHEERYKDCTCIPCQALGIK